jgi:uncharacterized membrane protein
MSNHRFSISEALQYGWSAFRGHVGFFLALFGAMAALTVLPDLLTEKIFTVNTAPYIVCKLIIRLIGVVLGMVATRLSLDLHDTGHTDFGRASVVLPQILPYLLSKILYGAAVFVGMLLLIVPGVIAAYMFFYVGYLIVDRGLGPIEAFKASKRVTDGNKWRLFLFSLTVALVNIAGLLVVFVGLFVTIPVTLMASAHVYRKLAPKDAAVQP